MRQHRPGLGDRPHLRGARPRREPRGSDRIATYVKGKLRDTLSDGQPLRVRLWALLGRLANLRIPRGQPAIS